MGTFSIDREFEVSKKELVTYGIVCMNFKLDRNDITRGNLRRFLYTKSILEMEVDSLLVWGELMLSELGDDEEDAKAYKYANMKAIVWLAGKNGAHEMSKAILEQNCLEYLETYQSFWSDVYGHYRSPKWEGYYRPSLLQWAIYLTVRGPIPESFPEEANYTYAIKRLKEIRQLSYNDALFYSTNNKDRSLEDVQQIFLKSRIKNLLPEAETYIAKADGNLEELKRIRLLRTLKGSINLDKVVV